MRVTFLDMSIIGPYFLGIVCLGLLLVWIVVLLFFSPLGVGK